MSNRRNFIKNLGALGLLLGTTKLDLNAQTTSKRSTTSTKINKPIVLSIWHFCLEANIEDWKVLGKNGTALNAVEQGVKLVEADSNEQSIGYGGCPNSDGN